MPRIHIIFLMLMIVTLGACQADSVPNVQPGGQPVRRTAKPPPATGPGIVLGGWAGGAILSAMDDDDRAHNRQAESRAFAAPVGQQVTWSNPDSGKAGTIVPLRDFYADNGLYCREFQQSVTIGGRKQQGDVKACQQADTSWQIAR